jgi:hypothetical protein
MIPAFNNASAFNASAADAAAGPHAGFFMNPLADDFNINLRMNDPENIRAGFMAMARAHFESVAMVANKKLTKAKADEEIEKIVRKRKYENPTAVSEDKLRVAAEKARGRTDNSADLGRQLADQNYYALCCFVSSKGVRCSRHQNVAPVNGVYDSHDADHDLLFCTLHRGPKYLGDHAVLLYQHKIINDALDAYYESQLHQPQHVTVEMVDGDDEESGERPTKAPRTPDSEDVAAAISNISL